MSFVIGNAKGTMKDRLVGVKGLVFCTMGTLMLWGFPKYFFFLYCCFSSVWLRALKSMPNFGLWVKYDSLIGAAHGGCGWHMMTFATPKSKTNSWCLLWSKLSVFLWFFWSNRIPSHNSMVSKFLKTMGMFLKATFS